MNEASATTSGWEDQRQHPRFPAWITGSVCARAGHPNHSVLIVDVSLGGVGLRASLVEPHDRFTLAMEWEGSSWEFECETVQHRKSMDGYAIHARFGPLNAIQRYCLKRLIADLEHQEQERI